MTATVRYTNGLMNGQARSALGSAGRFLWHLVQMLVAMMVGMGVFHMLIDEPSEVYLVLWSASMELSMIPTMVALMLYQGHGWRHSGEMAAAMLIGPAVFLGCAQLGWHAYIPGLTRETLFTLSDVTMFLGMLGAMLYRRGMYTRPHAAHQHIEAVHVHVHHGPV